MSGGALLDIIVIMLLALGGAGAWIVNQRLQRLVAAQEELNAALSSFDQATGRADAALKRLEANGLSKSADLQYRTAKAESLVNELSVMISAGERIADRIEGAVRDVRTIGAARNAGKPKRAA